jgi:hypothetical protein
VEPASWNEPLPAVYQQPDPYNASQSTPFIPARLPSVGEVPAAPGESPTMMYPRTSEPPPVNVPAPALPPTAANHVMPVSYDAPAPADWRQQLAGTIAAMEAETPNAPTTPAELSQQARLRMLYAAAGRRDDAARPIPAASPAAQQFLSKELDGLTTWLNAEQSPDTPQRAARTKVALADAMQKLSEMAPLGVCNLSFCTEVRSFGCTKRFEKYEFQANQEVLLYAEVENFVSELTPRGYHTLLKSSYQIFDGNGRRVADHAFAATEEHCRNRRRDFFIGYHVRLPEGLAAGKYRLQLTIEDLNSQKVGQASVEFEVKTKGEGGRRKGDGS